MKVRDLPTRTELRSHSLTKLEATSKLYRGLEEAFDTTLPQEWLDDFTAGDDEAYELLRSTVVWAYLSGTIFGFPLPLCYEAGEYILSKLSRNDWEWYTEKWEAVEVTKL